MTSVTRDVILYPEFREPTHFRQCAACFTTEYETSSPMHTCSRCRNTVCQKNDLPSHKKPCLQRRNAIRRKDRDSPDAKWKPRSRAGGEGAALVPFTELQNAFMAWTQKNARILAWTHYQATGMRSATGDGLDKCLSVKLSGHRDTPGDSIRFEVDNVETVNARDILQRPGMREDPFAEVRAKQRTLAEGMYVFAVLLECGPLVNFMPIGTPEELLQTWMDVPEWKEAFKSNIKS